MAVTDHIWVDFSRSRTRAKEAHARSHEGEGRKGHSGFCCWLRPLNLLVLLRHWRPGLGDLSPHHQLNAALILLLALLVGPG